MDTFLGLSVENPETLCLLFGYTGPQIVPNLAKLEFGIYVEKFVKLKRDLHRFLKM